MSTRMKVIVGVVTVALFAGIILLTLNQSQHRYEVCVNFHGRTHCAKGEGRTAQEAIQTAHSIACTMVTSGRDDNMACSQQQPASVKELR